MHQARASVWPTDLPTYGAMTRADRGLNLPSDAALCFLKVFQIHHTCTMIVDFSWRRPAVPVRFICWVQYADKRTREGGWIAGDAGR